MKCHWCNKESKNVYCSAKCVIEHEIRYDKSIKHATFILDTDDSVKYYKLNNETITPLEAIPIKF